MELTVLQAYEFCMNMARDHYENFPVASLFIPQQKRPHVAAIYAFARTADDFADEGDLQPFERLEKLDEWERKLDGCYAGAADHPVFVALAETVRQHNIPREPLAALLEAFRMDVTKRRYADFGELLHYCRSFRQPRRTAGSACFRGSHRPDDPPLRQHLYGPPAGEFLAGRLGGPGQGPDLCPA